MTFSLFIGLVTIVVIGALASFVFITRPVFTRFASRAGVMPPPMIGAISILFGLFIGFSYADINQRAGALRLATQREVSAARSIINFCSGVGPKAAPVRNALLDYLEVITTNEPSWLQSRSTGEAPGAAPAYSLSLIATGFVQEVGVSDVLKSALIARVDELIAARTERMTLAQGSGSIPQWLGLTALVLLTLLIGATSAPQRGGSAIFLAGYTATAIVALFYLAYTDGLIGPGRADAQVAQFRALLVQAPRLSGYGNDTLARIRSGGPVVIGARTDQYPFAFLDKTGKHVGYSIDLCRRIIERLHDPQAPKQSPIEVLPLSAANRVALIVNGTADIECDLTTKTATRGEQVDFLDSIFFGHAQIVVRADSGIADLDGLRHKRLTAVVGSSNMQAAADLEARYQLGLTVLPAKDMQTAFDMVREGGSDAMIGSDVLNQALINASTDRSAFSTFDSQLPARSYGFMVRQNDPAFEKAANRALGDIFSSGEFETIYKHWFDTAGATGFPDMHMPLSTDMRAKLAGDMKAAADRTQREKP